MAASVASAAPGGKPDTGEPAAISATIARDALLEAAVHRRHAGDRRRMARDCRRRLKGGQRYAGGAPIRRRVFRHGVASGDPLTDRVMLWTRATPRVETPSARCRCAGSWPTTNDSRQVVASGTVGHVERARLHREGGRRRAAARPHLLLRLRGRRRTLADRPHQDAAAGRRRRACGWRRSRAPTIRPATSTCIAASPTATTSMRCVHLGDYIYEFANGVYGDGSGIGPRADAGRRGLDAGRLPSCATPRTAATWICRRRTPRTRSSPSGTTTR